MNVSNSHDFLVSYAFVLYSTIVKNTFIFYCLYMIQHDSKDWVTTFIFSHLHTYIMLLAKLNTKICIL